MVASCEGALPALRPYVSGIHRRFDVPITIILKDKTAQLPVIWERSDADMTSL